MSHFHLRADDASCEAKEALSTEEKRDHHRYRVGLVVLIVVGVMTWLIGLVTASLLLVITGASVGVAAGWGLRAE